MHEPLSDGASYPRFRATRGVTWSLSRDPRTPDVIKLLFHSPSLSDFNIKQMSDENGIKANVNIKVGVKMKRVILISFRHVRWSVSIWVQADGRGLPVRDWLAYVLSQRDRISSISERVGVWLIVVFVRVPMWAEGACDGSRWHVCKYKMGRWQLKFMLAESAVSGLYSMSHFDGHSVQA